MPRHIVIVDDDDLNLRLLRRMVGELGDVVVRTYQSSAEALAWLEENDADCLIFDYNMPAPNGVELVTLVRAVDRFALVPIVMVTGEHERDVLYLALDAGANDFIRRPFDQRELSARLTTLLALRDAQRRLTMQVVSLEASLFDSERRSREHADRLEALWRSVSGHGLGNDELVEAMLREGAAAIRPHHNFAGILAAIDGTDLVVEASAAVPAMQIGELTAGRRFPIAETSVASAIRIGTTTAWDDLEKSDERSILAVKLGLRSLILSLFRAGGMTYMLAFTSTAPTVVPFGPEDHAYIEIVASLVAAHLQQRWQSLRIQQQLHHDSLTGLQNRSRFRSLGRIAFREDVASALAVVDLSSFHELNERYGHLVGDAVLVEVAAAISQLVGEDELVARVSGDAFGVFFPAVPSRAWLDDRLTEVAAIFDRGIAIGDREGRETVQAQGTIGVAVAPDDAETFDQLLFRAEGATRSSRGTICFFARESSPT